ncbi:hypothetical protein JMJ35_004382 [Cladonia borealis]|uniref:Ankyrin repeat protein n=1 Tax=Cladonia borealis TaxID=184061 RepID=A0AA39R4N7_9LECA|nr:hypothetical protein JMJ35_004382 [Cladonia borealis]
MSFGFAISDFIAVGQLAWTLYRECYQIARGAPMEFSLLVSELSTLSNSITILQEEVKDPKSTLTRSGNDRIRMVNEMVAGIEETLKRLKKVASKYDILGSGSKTKHIWAKLKWSAEFSSIDRLRNKLIYHNTVMNLLLTSVGNSSLQRIEISHEVLANNVQTIKDCIASNKAVTGCKVPALSAIDDDLMSTTLSANLMTNAEASQPWNTIGFDQWIGAGKWWLLRAQLVLRAMSEPGLSVAPEAYAALIKAGWILADVIPCHPQFPFISASKSSELQSLSAEVKNEFSRITALAMVVPALDQLSGQDLRLWESIPVKAPLLRPYKASQNLDAWRVDGGEHVLFRRFAFRELDSITTSPCILLLLVDESARAARLIAHDQYGELMKAISFSELPFREYVKSGDDGQSLMVGKEKFVLTQVQEAQVLCTMIEATTFYISERQVDHASLEDLKAYMLLTAVKNQQEQVVMQIRQEIPETDKIVESNQKESLARFAASMAFQWIEGSLFQDDNGDPAYRGCWNRHYSLLTWAVTCNYTTLTEFLLSENPAVDERVPDHNHPLFVAATYGNESVMRWFLSSPRASDKDVLKSLYIAMINRHENLAALLVDAGANITDMFDHSLENFIDRFLRNVLKVDAGADITDMFDNSLENFIDNFLRNVLSELVVHAILAFAYATKAESQRHLREAADRGHEGAVVLLSYAETMKRLDTCGYSSRLTHNSGKFQRVIAALANVPDTIPAFNLTLLTVERRRTQVLLEVVRGCVRVGVFLDSYHAYIEDVSEGLWENLKKIVTIRRGGKFSFTVVHQEENLKFTVTREKIFARDPFVNFEIGGHSKRISLLFSRKVSVEFPINWT